jgi:deazaflavin-dependent oxidoreductase (nitroreductase family)
MPILTDRWVSERCGGRPATARVAAAAAHWDWPAVVRAGTLGRMSGEKANRLARIGADLLRVRWFVRAPVWLYRARLGVIFGRRLLMLEHVGRNTGQRRFVVLEVVDHPAPDRYVVVSGFGTHAQWFRNVEANPHVRVYLASHAPAPATARRPDTAAATAALDRYAHAHPRAWGKLRPLLADTLGNRIEKHGTGLPIITLDVVDRTHLGGADLSR